MNDRNECTRYGCDSPAAICSYHNECTQCSEPAKVCVDHAADYNHSCEVTTCIQCYLTKSEMICKECSDRKCDEPDCGSFATKCWNHNSTLEYTLRTREREVTRREEQIETVVRKLALEAVAEILAQYDIPNPYTIGKVA